MRARLPGSDFRGEIRALMLAAREAGKDPLAVVGTYVAMRSLSAGSVDALAALLGPGKKRTAQRRRADLAALLGVTNMTPPPGLGVEGGVRNGASASNLSPHSLLSDDLTSREEGPASPAGVEEEGILWPTRGEQNSAASNLRSLGTSRAHVRACMAYALDKWPHVRQVREGAVLNAGGFLYSMVKDYARRMGYLDGRGHGSESADELVERGARRAALRRSKAPVGASPHRKGPPCPKCEEPTETGVGTCGNGRCAGFLKVTAQVG